MKGKDMYVLGRIDSIKDPKGWFIGHFADGPNNSLEMEAAFQKIGPEGIQEERFHYHAKASEVTIVLKGVLTVEIKDGAGHFQLVMIAGSYIFLKPGVLARRISALPGTELIVVKDPSVPQDKHMVE